MSPFDLLFLFVVLGTAAMLACASLALLRGRKDTALRAARALGIGLAAYLLVVAAVAVSAPQRVLRMGEERCFDEMCFAPTGVKVMPAIGPQGRQVKAAGSFYVVGVRASNHGQGRAQREAGVHASLVDAAGKVFEVSPEGQGAYAAAYGPSPGLTSRLLAGESVASALVFDVPHGTSGLAVHFGHDGPGLFIIGDDESPLHKPTITPLR